MHVIVIAPYDRMFEKTVSNMQEVAARDGKIILLSDPQGAHEAHLESVFKLTLPAMSSTVTPLVYAIPIQLIAIIPVARNPYDGHTLGTVIPQMEALMATCWIAASPMPVIAATTPRPITSSRSTRPARSGASRRR